MQTKEEKAATPFPFSEMILASCLMEKKRMNPDRYQISLPWPISANRYWRTYLPKGFRVPVTVVSPEAKAYKCQVAVLARVAGIREPIRGRVAVHIRLYPHRPQNWKKRQAEDPFGWDQSVRCLDLDNARKVLYDALSGVLFEDDRWIWNDSAERMVPDGEARVVVLVTSWR
jgi:crossover junction endodeoxyribonuclease RusA